MESSSIDLAAGAFRKAAHIVNKNAGSNGQNVEEIKTNPEHGLRDCYGRYYLLNCIFIINKKYPHILINEGQ